MSRLTKRFFLRGTHNTPRSRRGTVLLRDRGLIAKRYLTGWFTIDLLSVIPYDWLTCRFSSGSGNLNTMMILRLLRLLKLARIFRASRLFRRWQDHISFTFASIALMK